MVPFAVAAIDRGLPLVEELIVTILAPRSCCWVVIRDVVVVIAIDTANAK